MSLGKVLEKSECSGMSFEGGGTGRLEGGATSE